VRASVLTGLTLGLLAVVAGAGPARAGAPVLFAAHRGGSLLWPENSLLAFGKAVDLGADFLEFDVHLSRDGEPVVIHDATLDRTTTGRGPVRGLTRSELTALRLKDASGAATAETVPSLDEVVRVAGGNIDRFRFEFHADRSARRRRIREEQADRRPHRFALCARDHVEQQDEVGAGIERPRVLGRLHHGHLARRPAVDVVHLIAAVHRRETGTRVGALEHARGTPEIERQIRVVQHLRPVGAELDGAHVARRGDRHRNDEVAEHVATSRLQHVRVRQRQHEIGRAQLPAAGERRRLRRVGGVPLGRAALDPLRDERDLIVAEPPFAGELAMSGLGQPRRHRAALDGRRDRGRPATNRVVVEHAERRTSHADRIVGGT